MARIGIVVAAAVVAVVLFLVLRGGGDDDGGQAEGTTAPTQATTTDATTTGTTGETSTAPPPPGPREIEINVPADGPSGIQRIDVQQGERVVLVIRSGIADHVHVHGYDLLADVAPGRTARIRFEASRPGRFEIELEDRGQPIAELRVQP
jgi:hypothetical protein